MRTYDNNEAETIGARRVCDKGRIFPQPVIDRGRRMNDVTPSMSTSEEDDEPDTLFRSPDSPVTSEEGTENPWSNKNLVKRLMDGHFDYDGNRTPYEMAEKEDQHDHNNHQADLGMAARAERTTNFPANEWPNISPVKHQVNGSKLQGNANSQQESHLNGQQKDHFNGQQKHHLTGQQKNHLNGNGQQKHHPNGSSPQKHQANGTDQRPKLDDRRPSFVDEGHLEHAVPAVGMHNEFTEVQPGTITGQRQARGDAHHDQGMVRGGGPQAGLIRGDGHLIRESHHQSGLIRGDGHHHQQIRPQYLQKQPKTLAFAPQEPEAIDGRPALPMNAKKLQQQQAASRQKAQQKKRRFPTEDPLADVKKGKKIETVPETCRLQGVQWIENGSRRFLWHLGRRLTTVPALMVVLPLIVCALSTIGVIVRRDTLSMVVPFFSFSYPDPASNGRFSSLDLFNWSSPRYDSFRRLSVESGAEFSVILRTEEHNVLEEEVIDSYLRLRKKIEDIKVVNGQKNFKYSALCRRGNRDTCPEDLVETLMSSGKNIKFHYPETEVPVSLLKKDGKGGDNSTTVFYLGNTFGGVETDQDGALAKAEALAMYFKLKQPVKTDTKEANREDLLKLWDEEFQRLMKEEELAHVRGKAGTVSWWSYGAFVAEVTATFNKIYIYLAASLGVFAVGCLVAALKGNSYSMKPGLGLAAAIIIFLVVGGGWCVEIGISGYVNPAVFPAFFFSAAAALHLMMNTLQSWRKYSMIAMDPGERIRIILSWESPCLLWCCLIISISCMITASVVSMPFYRSICQFLAASSILIMFLVLLLFVGVMYVGGKRELAGFKWFHCGKVTAEFPPPLIRRYHKRDVQLLQKKMRDEHQHVLRSMGELAANVNARYVALLIFCIYLIFAAWGCSLAPIKMTENHYISPSTNLHHFLTDYSEYYGKYDNYLVLTFYDSIDYFDNRIRSAILDMLAWVEMQEHVAEKTISWLREFGEFEKSSIYLINHDTFVPVVDLIFLKEGSPYQRFNTDISFGRYREQIVASRMYIELNTVGMQRQLEIVKILNGKAAEAGLPMSVWSPSLFLLQHDVQLTQSTITAMTLLIGVISILSLIVFAQPYLTLLTILTTCSVSVGTVGLSALWEVPVNALNMSVVLAGVVHSAVLCITCSYYYGNSGDVTAVRRMAFTFQSWYPGAIWSSIIGLVSFSPLLFIDCPLIQHLAKLFLCHFLSIILHVTVFLPPCLVLLTTSVPTCCKLMKKMGEDSFCCCSSEEDATSIYYIPTGGRPLDPVYVQQFYQLKFREDILPPPPVHPLPPPPVREMLMPPPPRGPPSSVAESAVQHMSREQHRCASPPPAFESRMHSNANSMQRHDAKGPTAKVYRYGSSAADFEDIMRARSARAAMHKRHLSPDVSDPSHHPRGCPADVSSPRSRRHTRAATSPTMEPRHRHHTSSEEIYHEPSDPDTMSMRTSNTNADYTKHNESTRAAAMNAATSPPGAAIDSADEEEAVGRGKSLKPYETRLVESNGDGPPKSKITYAKWSKEIPLDPFTTERVTAEKYTIEGDGHTIDLPPDWKRFWIKGNLRGQALPGPNGPDIINGMVPPGDHHIPMHQGPPHGQHFRPPFHHPPPRGPGPMGDGAPMMMPPYGAPPPLPRRPPPFGLPGAPGPNAFRGQFRKTPAWMY